jgi:hypothetical protein
MESDLENNVEPSVSVLESPKARGILEACRVAEQSSNVDALIQLAISDGGFLHDSLRRRACMYSHPRDPRDGTLNELSDMYRADSPRM